MRILNIVENLDNCAVDNWIVNVFLETRVSRKEWQWTFYCILNKEGRLAQKVREAGGEIIYTPYSISQKFKFIRSLRHTLKTGKYDIIHSHHDFLSGFYLLATFNIPYKKRILHIHNTDAALPIKNKLLHNFLLGPFRALAIYFSDIIVGISNDTLEVFTSGQRKKNKFYHILYYGINLLPFQGPAKISLHNAFDIPPGSVILLFAGRMTPLKNPGFVMDIMKELQLKSVNAFALFVGTGDEENTVIVKAEKYNLKERIRLLGWRDDIADLMKTSDVFVFPRVEYPKEGLGLVVVEAQAAGLPMLITKGIVEDAIIIKELASILPFKENPEVWADSIIKICNTPQILRSTAFKKIKESRFNILHSAKAVINLYEL